MDDMKELDRQSAALSKGIREALRLAKGDEEAAAVLLVATAPHPAFAGKGTDYWLRLIRRMKAR